MQHMLYIFDLDNGENAKRMVGTEQECAKALCEFMHVKEVYPESFIGKFKFIRWGNRYIGEICPVESDEISMLDNLS